MRWQHAHQHVTMLRMSSLRLCALYVQLHQDSRLVLLLVPVVVLVLVPVLRTTAVFLG